VSWHIACSGHKGMTSDSRGSLLASAGLGASLMYFLDPRHGARRRTRMRDLCFRLMHAASDAAATTSRDVRHRWQGIVASLRNPARCEDVDDDVLRERVRATMGHYVSHSHAIQVDASAGVVTVKGPIIEREAAKLRSAVRRVRGVTHVIDALERHEHGAHEPALQGGQLPAGSRFDVLRPRWGPATRLTMGMAGAMLAFAGVGRPGVARSVMGMLGLGVLARALANAPLRNLVRCVGGTTPSTYKRQSQLTHPSGFDGPARVSACCMCRPQAGSVTAVAAAFGVGPKTSMDEDLVRMKSLIETGHAPHDAAQAIVADR
jgi:hypothetical protein